MADLGTNENWIALTETWKKAQTEGIDRFRWEIKDGTHRFQFIFSETQNSQDRREKATLFIGEQNTVNPWTFIIRIGVTRTGRLYPLNAPEFDEKGLKDALGIGTTPHPRHAWNMANWIHKALNKSSKAQFGHTLYPHQLPREFTAGIEDEQKTVFWCIKETHGNQTLKNYEKTLRLMGKKVADYCRETNQSSHWKADPALFNQNEWERIQQITSTRNTNHHKPRFPQHTQTNTYRNDTAAKHNHD